MEKPYSLSRGDGSITYSGKCINSEHYCADHCHASYEILCFVSAKGKYIIEGVEYNIQPGSILFINPFAYHRVEFDTGECEYYSLCFSADMVLDADNNILDSIVGDKENSARFYPYSSINSEIFGCFYNATLLTKLDEISAVLYLKTIITQILLHLSVNKPDLIAREDDVLGARVMRYLNRNITKNISLDRLAGRFFVSKYYLCRAFKEYSGISVHSYINHKRILFARQMIENGITASKAAEKVGFGDYSAFYRAYVRIVGKSPTAE